MDSAKFWNVDGFSWITPQDYERNPELFDGHLYCPDEACHAAVKYRKGSLTEGTLHPRKAHFWTDRGQEHRDGCDFTSEIDAKDKVRFEDALSNGDQVLLNLNFQTSYHQTLDLPTHYRRAVFNKTGASLYEAWRKSTTYVRKSIRTANAFFEAAKSIERIGRSNGINDVLSQVSVSHNGGVVDYRDFCLLDDEAHSTFFNRLVGTKATIRSSDKPLWNLTAALRRMNLREASKQKGSSTLLGKSYKTKVEGVDIQLGDKIIFYGDAAELREEVLARGRVTLIGNPNIDREQLQTAISGGRPFVDVNWVVASKTQILLPK